LKSPKILFILLHYIEDSVFGLWDRVTG